PVIGTPSLKTCRLLSGNGGDVPTTFPAPSSAHVNVTVSGTPNCWPGGPKSAMLTGCTTFPTAKPLPDKPPVIEKLVASDTAPAGTTIDVPPSGVVSVALWLGSTVAAVDWDGAQLSVGSSGQTSHRSPPSCPSEFRWSGFTTVGQLSS